MGYGKAIVLFLVNGTAESIITAVPTAITGLLHWNDEGDKGRQT